MTRVTKSVSIPLEVWVTFTKLNPDATRNFSQWVTKQCKRSIEQPRPVLDTQTRCTRNDKFKGAVVSLQMCSGCGVEECEDRVG